MAIITDYKPSPPRRAKHVPRTFRNKPLERLVNKPKGKPFGHDYDWTSMSRPAAATNIIDAEAEYDFIREFWAGIRRYEERWGKK